ncbi:hypothetical protein ANACOL_00678 [Anaerotruncus colihominis DSM 17241]|uniref:Uncharacterized protein n=1 Tax=Anaerotruncus colihominis DSM 17241 TaxID=445972 RepID=B0P7E7_9FIRM|nr:hypothetical protein ANACOL_00678 [Anaerotruncus colihominis DSM 17241]
MLKCCTTIIIRLPFIKCKEYEARSIEYWIKCRKCKKRMRKCKNCISFFPILFYNISTEFIVK